MLLRIDRIIRRVDSLESVVRYYRDTLGLKLLRHEKNIASFALGDGATELIFHDNIDQPFEEIYYLVDDVRDLYRRRESLKLKFKSAPRQVARGFRATVEDPFGNILLLIDRTTGRAAGETTIEHAAAPATLFAGVVTRVAAKKDALIAAYAKLNRTADDLPYTPHFETLYSAYAAALDDPKPTRQEVWRHLLNLRKAGKLPKLGEAKSKPPEVSPEHRALLREMLGADIGKRDRLPYTDRFDQLVNEFNQTQSRPLSPHLVWRLVATLAK